MTHGQLTHRRANLVDRYGSPVFTYTPANIAAAAVDFMSVEAEFPDSRKWAPLDHVTVSNGSDENVRVEFNRDETHRVFAGQEKTLILVPHEIRITNDGAGVLGTGDLEIQMWRAALDTDQALRNNVRSG